VGSPLELYHHPNNLFVAGFIGSPRMNFLPVTVASVSGSMTTLTLPQGESVTIPVQSKHLSVGDRATLGIRPEHLRFDANNATTHAEVQVLERLGGETFAYVRLAGGDTMVVQTDGDSPVRLHDQVPIYINGDRCHLFDAQGVTVSKKELHPLAV
jgi:multiple sugar transport system ATP-binding protein